MPFRTLPLATERRVFLAALVCAACPLLRAQGPAQPVTGVPRLGPGDLRGAPAQVLSSPPSLTLIARAPNAHAGTVWLRSSDDGLHVWVKVQADEQGFRWPQQKSEVLSSDHIELWLAASSDIPMPPVGWGNQFGMTELKSEKDCDSQTDSHTGIPADGVRNCRRWYAEQLQYRQSLKRLFVRQWLIAGPDSRNFQSHFFEDFASTAYGTLEANLFHSDLPAALKPVHASDTAFRPEGDSPSPGELAVQLTEDRKPEVRHRPDGRPYDYNRLIGYTAHIVVPYSAFPPTQQFNLQDLYLMVDVFSNAAEGQKQGAYSTTSGARQWGNPATFNHVRLESPRRFAITPCEATPVQTDLYGDTYKPWFYPNSTEDGVLTSTFALINPEEGYLYDPAGASPQAHAARYFSKPLPGGATVCGPSLAWRKGDQMKRSKFAADPAYFEVKPLGDGWTLLRSGPSTSTHSPFGSGQCGSCLEMEFDMFAVSPAGEITSALSIEQDLSGQDNNPESADMTISPDWQRITVFFKTVDYEAPNAPSNWTSTAYCLAGHAYKQCDQQDHAQPPKPPHFKEIRQND